MEQVTPGGVGWETAPAWGPPPKSPGLVQEETAEQEVVTVHFNRARAVLLTAVYEQSHFSYVRLTERTGGATLTGVLNHGD